MIIEVKILNSDALKKLVRQVITLLKIRSRFVLGKKHFIYIHIPKCAGSSIQMMTLNSPYKQHFTSGSHSLNVRDIKGSRDNCRLFASIRNPLAWYASLYNFKMHTDSNDPDKDYPRMPGNSWEDFVEDVILGKNGLEGYKKWHKPWRPKKHLQEMLTYRNHDIGFFTLNFLYYCFNEWKNILLRKDISDYVIINYPYLVTVDHILRIEHLQDDFNKMLTAENVSFPISFNKKINACEHSPYMKYYTDDMVNIIRNKDRVIFDIFGY